MVACRGISECVNLRGLFDGGPFLTLCYNWAVFPSSHVSSGLAKEHIGH